MDSVKNKRKEEQAKLKYIEVIVGQEYDYVFEVELTEGRPALKLPYNAGEDPWMAAHTWLEKNDLSPLFLDQVLKIIRHFT